jgi:sugar phosphate isomerase/epimerase
MVCSDKKEEFMKSNSRRRFLQESLTAAAAVAAAPIVGGGLANAAPTDSSGQSSAKAPDIRPNRISILSYSFLGLFKAGKMDVFGYLESCKYRYNLEAANIWNGFLTSTEEDYLKKVRDALDERELVLAVLTCDDCHIWDPDPEERKKNYANAMAHLKAGKILGAQFVRIDAGGPRDGDRTSPAAKEWSNEAFDGIVKRYQEYAQYANDNGFKMGPENHWGPEGIWSNMQKLYKAMDKRPGFALSVHMSQWQGTPEEKDIADKESAPWVAAVHFDNNTCEGPLAEKMILLRDAGYKGYWVVENHSGGQNEYAAVAALVAHVRYVLQSF